ncbi:MAG TPA: condensation domain-containing protein [Blastocatellia bacterium]|nr:condensation domain-containing protein [Blastocatellia bacterium]
MKGLSERISALSPEQRALFEARLKKKGVDAGRAISRTEAICKRKQLNFCPLSHDQERLWAIDRNGPGNTAYNIYTASRLRGPLDAEVMSRAINEIVRRHEILRTTFAAVEGRPVMVIASELEISLPVDDLTPLPESEREREAMRRVNEEAARPFDLARGPLVRVGLLRLAEDDHVMHMTMHHTITDRWSAAIVEQELGVLYDAFMKGKPSPLPEAAIQFADFAAWQREWLRGEALESQLAYWRSQLAGAPLVLNLPTDRPRPAAQTFRGARERILLPANLLAALKAMSQREGATMFMTALAAYNLLLYRCAGQPDILVGLTVSNRERPETVEMPGYLLNMVALRTRLSNEMSFRALLRQVREAALGAFSHQDLPLGLLIDELKPEPDLSRNPIFQVSYIYLDFPELSTMSELGLKVTPVAADNGSSRFDLTLALTERSNGLETLLEYNTDLFEAATVKRMLNRLGAILRAVVEEPDRPISELP